MGQEVYKQWMDSIRFYRTWHSHFLPTTLKYVTIYSPGQNGPRIGRSRSATRCTLDSYNSVMKSRFFSFEMLISILGLISSELDAFTPHTSPYSKSLNSDTEYDHWRYSWICLVIWDSLPFKIFNLPAETALIWKRLPSTFMQLYLKALPVHIINLHAFNLS